jgi:hypothetical protein
MPRRPFRIGRSLTGFGLFATRPIKKKSRIAEYKGPILDAEEAERAERRGNRYLYEVSKQRTIDGTPRRNVARYANHSCNPNAESIIWRGRGDRLRLRHRLPEERDRPLQLQMLALPPAQGAACTRAARLEAAPRSAAGAGAQGAAESWSLAGAEINSRRHARQ